MDNKEIIKEIKHSFMAFRNGIVSDTLRHAGMPYKIIFGLQIPQISEISRHYSPSLSLASELWEDAGIRESRLLACYLFPVEEINQDKALELAFSVLTIEEADILCFRLLRRLSFAREIAGKLSDSNDRLTAYCGEALKRNLKAMN